MLVSSCVENNVRTVIAEDLFDLAAVTVGLVLLELLMLAISQVFLLKKILKLVRYNVMILMQED